MFVVYIACFMHHATPVVAVLAYSSLDNYVSKEIVVNFIFSTSVAAKQF